MASNEDALYGAAKISGQAVGLQAFKRNLDLSLVWEAYYEIEVDFISKNFCLR